MVHFSLTIYFGYDWDGDYTKRIGFWEENLPACLIKANQMIKEIREDGFSVIDFKHITGTEMVVTAYRPYELG